MRLLLIIGPPAVGKMTVGQEIVRRSTFRLFHNHHTIEPLVEVFGYGTPPFTILNSEFRRRVIEEAARHEVDLIFTFVWSLADAGDAAEVRELVEPYVVRGGHVAFLELAAGLDQRLQRNRGASRLAAKPTKRDVAWSDDNVRSMERWTMNTDPSATGGDGEGDGTALPATAVLDRFPHLRLDTSELSPGRTAELALGWLTGLDGRAGHEHP